jgi:hypothetical protein
MPTRDNDDSLHRPVSRRTFLKTTSMALGAGALGTLVAGCGASTPPSTNAPAGATAAADAAGGATAAPAAASAAARFRKL